MFGWLRLLVDEDDAADADAAAAAAGFEKE